jgi:DNA-directed RNA polymerase sigma subunit (sigma70/sigma32)
MEEIFKPPVEPSIVVRDPELIENLYRIMYKNLTCRERDIIFWLYLEEPQQKIQDVAYKMELSYDRIRQLRDRALLKLRFKLNMISSRT